ncbi:M24 family metallopeptidase [Anaerotalea alkaliphila]|uniref:Peptidase M24 domain-containing protein n=1 Tax=Anaerotalea alkaliphila TaxID=2662126 RepID=A0A7X5KNR5_9FIRM|nr:M24 family metallopeptidase [Anaerotalea alkaliphila]NDL67007.1 hypothetical protein [Anaerotalea alkaliphila]
MERSEDFRHKTGKIREALEAKGYGCVEIRSQDNFSCITGGRGFIGLASTRACASLFITRDQVFLVAENIEADRLMEEQLYGNEEVQVLSYPWYAYREREAIVERIASGCRIASEEDLAPELFRLRTVLSPHDIGNYRKLCRESAEIVESICKNLRMGVSEYALAGRISEAFWSANIEPITLLVAFDRRALRYRHPVMTENRLENYALVSVCGRRKGLVASLTRNVLLRMDREMVLKHQACGMVHTAFIHGLETGRTLEDVFLEGLHQYDVQGWPLEHKEHHQGGLTGYAPRALRAKRGCGHRISANESYAFNPTIQGAKCEETVLLTEAGVEVMTHTGNYTYVDCDVAGKRQAAPTVLVLGQ